MESSRHVYLRAPAASRELLTSELPKVFEVVASGDKTVADATAVWFELLLPSAATVPQVRDRLARAELSDHVVRVDLLRKRGFGASQATQTELFQEGPRVPHRVTPEPSPVRLRRPSGQKRLPW